jgi:hypothetical protein
MDKEMKKQFIEMLKEERNSPTGWAVIMSMVSMLGDDERMDYLAEMHKGIHEYGNFMTEKEAKKVVEGFVSFDGSRGQKWSMDTIADELRKVNGVLEEKHHYNKWVLYVMMNNEYADYGGVLQKLGLPQQDIPKAIYMMALAKIDDKDRRESIREYFGLE